MSNPPEPVYVDPYFPNDYQEHYQALMTRNHESTAQIDYDFLDHIGLRYEFDLLTSRVGITRHFFNIPI